jgi:geranylgeranyl pyrophosphate synthase
MKWVIEQGGIAYAERKMEEICKDALLLIQDIKDPEIFRALSSFLLYCKDRKK